MGDGVRVSLRPSHLVRPSFTKVSGARINTRVEEALVPEDSVRQEAHHVCSEWLQLQRLKRHVEGNLELTCP
jgi:hypothetical protein